MARTIVEEVANCKVYSDGSILVQNVRFSYPHVDAPWSKSEKERKKHTIVGLMPKGTHKPAKNLLKKYMDKMLADNKVPAMASKDKFLRDGDQGSKEEAFGHYTLNASSAEDDPPSVRGKDTRPIPQNKIKTLVRPGYWGDILIKPWWQDNEHGKKINAGLVAVQVKREDEEFGEGRIGEDAIDETFEAVDDDSSGFDEDDDDDL